MRDREHPGQAAGILGVYSIRSISAPSQLETAWSGQYAHLSKAFSRRLPTRGVLVEIGCGKGQLTIPLSKMVPRLRIIGVDSFKGPYSKNQAELLSALAGLLERGRVNVVVNDYRSWIARQPDSMYDAIISSEFLPEIDAKRMRDFFVACHRVLKLGGRTIHSFLSPVARNARQRRLIEADSDPQWTKTPPAEWFSPNPKLVRQYLMLAGFNEPTVTRLRSELLVRSDAARELLRDWDIRRSYWKSHEKVLQRNGLELPDWIIIDATKTHP